MTDFAVGFIDQDPFTAALVQAIVFLVVIRLLDVWSREPFWAVGLMALWGAVGATTLSLPGNTALGSLLSPDLEAVWGAAISAPLVEETAKGLALVAAFVASYQLRPYLKRLQFNGVSDGMVYGAAIGIGFAFAENNFYFAQQGDFESGSVILQLREGFFNLGTLGHAVYTGVFGAGLGLATWSSGRAARVGFPLLGLGLAMLMHAVNNGFAEAVLVRKYGFENTAVALRGEPLPADLVAAIEATYGSAGTAVQVFGYAIIGLFFLGMVLWSRYQQRVLAYELAEEAENGLVSREEVAAVTRYGRRLTWYWQIIRAGQFEQLRSLRAAHTELCELAFAKWRVRMAGGDPSDAEAARRRFEKLRADAAASH
jgi:RsiW-degrading membrane proteinase PrsW (M82 family)